MQSPFLLYSLQENITNITLAPNIFILLVAIVTSTLHLGILTNQAIDKIGKLYGKDEVETYGNAKNTEIELTFWKTLYEALKKLLCLFWFFFRWIICNQERSEPEKTNKARQLAYANRFRDNMNSVMFLQISLIVFIIFRIMLFSFGLKEILFYDLLIEFFAFLALGFFWPLVFLKITYGSK